MKRQTRSKIGLWVILLLLAYSIGMADQPYPQTTLDANSPFVRLLEARYKAYHLAAKNGDVTVYEAVRPREIVDSMRNQLIRTDKMDDYSSMLKKFAENHVDLDEYTFHRGDRKVNIARLIYERLNPKTKITEYAVIMFHFEDNAWKVGPTGSIQTAGIPRKEQSPAGVPKPPTLRDLLEQEHFQLPK